MEEQHIGFEIGRLGNLIQRKRNDDFSNCRENLTHMQSKIIRYLLLSEQQKSEVFQRDIEAFFRIRRSTATNILQLMERNGLLRRERVPYDARLKRLALTDKARSLHDEIHQYFTQTEAVMRRNISDEDLQTWFAVCKQIRINLEQFQNHEREETL